MDESLSQDQITNLNNQVAQDNSNQPIDIGFGPGVYTTPDTLGKSVSQDIANSDVGVGTPSLNLPSLNDISNFIQKNKGILTLGAAGSVLSGGGGGGGGGTPASNTSIPNLVANRMQVPGAAGPVTPGQPGRQYFTDTIYSDPSQQANAQAMIQAQAAAIAQNQLNAPIPSFAMPWNGVGGGQNMGGQGISGLGQYAYPTTMTQQGLNPPNQNSILDPSKTGLSAQQLAAQQLAAQQAAAQQAAAKAAADAAALKAQQDAANKLKNTTTDPLLAAYQAGDFTKAQQLINSQKLSPQDIVTKYGLSPTDAATVAKNLGYTGDLSSLNYGAAAAPAAAPAVSAAQPDATAAPVYYGQGVSGSDIVNFVNANMGDPATIASAMQQYGLSANDVAAATGYSPQQVSDYIATASSGDSGVNAASGGIMGLAAGGSTSRQPRYLQGSTDGMADEINTSIDDKEPAKLSHGEFVIPADVVSHLGNGNSDAGANKLYDMMSKIRKARTGNPKQGKQINPDKFMPGGIARLAVGGSVKGFAGLDGSAVSSGSTSSIPGVTNTGGVSSQGLSSYVAPYVTQMLGQGQALANAPMQTYQGPLTADASALQKQQFAGLSELGQTGYNPMQYQTQSFTNQGIGSMPDVSTPDQTSLVSQAASGQPFTQATGAAAAPTMGGTSPAAQYMNPYLSASLQPQLDALKYQSQQDQQSLFGNLTKQGAFGGSRQAVAQGVGEGNLLAKQGDIIGQGYNTAYNNAMNQFNSDQQRQLQAQADTEASRQYSANYGLNTLNAMGQAGATQQGIQQAADTAAQQQFKDQQAYPYQQLAFQQSLLQGLPVGTTSTTPNSMSDLGNLLSVLGVAGNKDITSGLKTLLGMS